MIILLEGRAKSLLRLHHQRKSCVQLVREIKLEHQPHYNAEIKAIFVEITIFMLEAQLSLAFFWECNK
jgi:hypothetical protein